MPAASVIVPARNAAATIGATLAALAEQDFEPDYEVIVADDGSEDDTAEIVARSPHARLVRTAGGEGPGPARNVAAAACSGTVLAFTDADCAPTSGWLRSGVEALAAADLVQGAVHADPAVRQGPFDRTVWVTHEAGLYECASLFLRRELFDRLGGFEDFLAARLGKPLAEDVWLGWRARRSGARTAFCDAALVHHAVFRRGAAEFVAERARLVYFPLIARRVPELRGTAFFARRFLSRRSAAFDAAAVGVAAALASGSRLPLFAVGPWIALLGARARRWGRRAPVVAAAEAAADAVGFVALLTGSARARTLLV